MAVDTLPYAKSARFSDLSTIRPRVAFNVANVLVAAADGGRADGRGRGLGGREEAEAAHEGQAADNALSSRSSAFS